MANFSVSIAKFRNTLCFTKTVFTPKHIAALACLLLISIYKEIKNTYVHLNACINYETHVLMCL